MRYRAEPDEVVGEGWPPRLQPWLFTDRYDAGRRLGERLLTYRGTQPIVLALPRGGVPVAFEIARALDAPLDVFPVRKLGVPWQRELGFGAIAPGGAYVLDMPTVNALGITRAQIARIVTEEAAELERRRRRFRDDLPLPDLRGRTVILVDDGLATGMSALAAVRAVHAMDPGRIVLAVPVCAPETAERMRSEVDDLVCLARPANFVAVGHWYRTFDQTSDEEVLDLLERARRPESPTPNSQ